ncbi:hypothetical protein [Flavobacterium sp.]|uniref:hypothetical protein n=1 Tax=Flavobacterium sp. TaxID=239 RepID=UPI002627BB04|nr:hypothetical protein [Flavobacterium sp.]
MDKIKTFEEACALLGISTDLPDFSAMPEKEQKALIAHYKLVIIAKALNGDWIPDWKNDKWDKYYPWFNMGSPSGVGFSFFGYGCWYAHSIVGSRLCFKSAELAKYAGTQFEELYKDYFVLSA